MWWLLLLSCILATLFALKAYEYLVTFRITVTNRTKLNQVSIFECLKSLAGPHRIHQCEFHEKLSRKYNAEPFVYFLAHLPVIVFSNPDDIRNVNLQWKSFEKTIQFLGPHARKMLGENVVFSNGDKYSLMRKLMDPAFYNVDRFIPLMEEKSNKCLDIASRLQQPVNVTELMTALTLDVLGEAILGYDFKCLDSLEEPNSPNKKLIEQYHYMMKEAATIMRIVGGEFFAKLPLSSNKKLNEAMKAIDQLIAQIIENHRKEGCNNSTSLLEIMITAANESEGQFTDEHIRSNIIVFLVAGHDTTQTSLSFAIYILAKMPEIQNKLRSELNLDSNYIDNFIKENLRLFTPGPTSILRKSTKSQTIGGLKIEKGQYVECSYYAMHRSTKIWGKDADQFRPERFDENIHSQHAYSPFSSGARTCLGKVFSITEQKIFLKQLISRFNLSLLDEKYTIKYMDQGPLLAVDRNLKVNFYKID